MPERVRGRFVICWPRQFCRLYLPQHGGETDVLVEAGMVEYRTLDEARRGLAVRRFWWPGMAYELLERSEDGQERVLERRRVWFRWIDLDTGKFYEAYAAVALPAGRRWRLDGYVVHEIEVLA